MSHSLKLSKIEKSIKEDMWFTESPYELQGLLNSRPRAYRVLIDNNRNLYMICPATKYVHNTMLEEAWNEGWYSEYMMDDINYRDYIDENEGFLSYLIFIPWNPQGELDFFSSTQEGDEDMYSDAYNTRYTYTGYYDVYARDGSHPYADNPYTDFEDTKLYKIIGNPDEVVDIYELIENSNIKGDNIMVKKMKKRIKNSKVDIKVKHEGILEVPEGKKVDELPLKHFEELVDKKGYDAIIRALNNLQVWNKNDNPELSKWAEGMMEKLKKKFRPEEASVKKMETIIKKSDKEYKIYKSIGNFSDIVFESDNFYEVQDFLEDEWQKYCETERVGLDDEKEHELFMSYYSIEESSKKIKNSKLLSDMLAPKTPRNKKPLQVKFIKKLRDDEELFENTKSKAMYIRKPDGNFYNMKYQLVDREFDIVEESSTEQKFKENDKVYIKDFKSNKPFTIEYYDEATETYKLKELDFSRYSKEELESASVELSKVGKALAKLKVKTSEVKDLNKIPEKSKVRKALDAIFPACDKDIRFPSRTIFKDKIVEENLNKDYKYLAQSAKNLDIEVLHEKGITTSEKKHWNWFNTKYPDKDYGIDDCDVALIGVNSDDVEDMQVIAFCIKDTDNLDEKYSYVIHTKYPYGKDYKDSTHYETSVGGWKSIEDMVKAMNEWQKLENNEHILVDNYEEPTKGLIDSTERLFEEVKNKNK